MDKPSPPSWLFDTENGQLEAQFGDSGLHLKGGAISAFAVGVALGVAGGIYATHKAYQAWKELRAGGGNDLVRISER